MSSEFEQRFTVRIGGVSAFNFVRRPVSTIPSEGTMGCLDNGHPTGWTDRQPAMFKDGEWKPHRGEKLRFVPQYWTVLDVEGIRP